MNGSAALREVGTVSFPKVHSELVPVFFGQRVRGWPPEPSEVKKLKERRLRYGDEGNSEDNAWGYFRWFEHASYTPLATALTKRYVFDAHLSAYSAPEIDRRLNLPALEDPFRKSLRNEELRMSLAIFDNDHSGSHKAGGSGELIPIDDWWELEKIKIAALEVNHPGVFAYRTKGGYRCLYWLSAPFALKKPEDGEVWRTMYQEWCAYLKLKFDIYADPSCDNWGRMFRLPHATRDGAEQPEERETIGDPGLIGTWAPTIDSECVELAKTIRGKEKKLHLVKPRADNHPQTFELTGSGEGILFHAFNKRGWILKQLRVDKWAVQCPNEAAHSSGKTSPTSTVLYAPKNGSKWGTFHCSHAHCKGFDVLSILSTEEKRAAAEAAVTAVMVEAQAAPAAESTFEEERQSGIFLKTQPQISFAKFRRNARANHRRNHRRSR